MLQALSLQLADCLVRPYAVQLLPEDDLVDWKRRDDVDERRPRAGGELPPVRSVRNLRPERLAPSAGNVVLLVRSWELQGAVCKRRSVAKVIAVVEMCIV